MECFICLRKLNKENLSPGIGAVIRRKGFKSEISTELPKGEYYGPAGVSCGNEIEHSIVYIEEVSVCVDCREAADSRNRALGVHINHILDFDDDA